MIRLRSFEVPTCLLALCVAACSSERASIAVGALPIVDDVPVDTVSRSFRVTALLPWEGPLHIEHVAGGVRLERADGDEVVVDVTGFAEQGEWIDCLEWTSWTDDEGRTVQGLDFPIVDHPRLRMPYKVGRTDLALRARGSEVTVSANDGDLLFADLVVRVPDDRAVSIRNLAGPVEVRGVRADVAIEALGGHVSLDGHQGSIAIETAQGPIDVANAHGAALELRSVSGWIQVATCDVEALTIESISGAIQVEDGHADRLEADCAAANITLVRCDAEQIDVGAASGDLLIRECRAETLGAGTGSGDVELVACEAFRLSAGAGSGKVAIGETEFVQISAATGAGLIEIDADADAERIHATSGSGDVVVHLGEGVSFDLVARAEDGRVRVGYADARLWRDGEHTVGARRGRDGIEVQLASVTGDCTLGP